VSCNNGHSVAAAAAVWPKSKKTKAKIRVTTMQKKRRKKAGRNMYIRFKINVTARLIMPRLHRGCRQGGVSRGLRPQPPSKWSEGCACSAAWLHLMAWAINLDVDVDEEVFLAGWLPSLRLLEARWVQHAG